VTRLQRAAVVALCIHLLAGLSMLIVLRRGLETNPVFQDRLVFLVNSRPSWTFAWLTWTAAAIAILYFYVVFADVHRPGSRLAILLTVAGVGADLAGQAIEIGVLPRLAYQAHQASSTNAAAELFLALHRVAVMLSGYVGNGLYSVTAMLLAWSARHAYPAWVSSIGIAVGVFGIALSAATLLDSVAGMFWINVFLVPSILLWLGGVAICKRGL
jgi:hypothetical protein